MLIIGFHELLITPLPTVHGDCRLLSLLLFVSLYCKHHGPRSACSKRSSLIRVHRVCFHGNSISGKADGIFLTNIGSIRVNPFYFINNMLDKIFYHSWFILLEWSGIAGCYFQVTGILLSDNYSLDFK